MPLPNGEVTKPVEHRMQPRHPEGAFVATEAFRFSEATRAREGFEEEGGLTNTTRNRHVARKHT